MLAANFSFYRGFYPRGGGPGAEEKSPPFQYGTSDGYAFYLGLGGLRSESPKMMPPGNMYWDDNLKHPTYDAFWKSRAIASADGIRSGGESSVTSSSVFSSRSTKLFTSGSVATAAFTCRS